jgi:AbrB family looped-hinge helix DNA binding protein
MTKRMYKNLVEEHVMNEFVATVSSKNQVTLPSGVRKHLGIGASDKVSFVVDKQGVHLRPAKLKVSDLYGSVSRRPGQSDDIEEQIANAMDERAADIVRKLRNP